MFDLSRKSLSCSVRFPRHVFIRLRQAETTSDTSVQLFREICKLTNVSWILEQNHVVGIQTHGSSKLVFQKQVLGEENDADVSVVRTFRKLVGYRLVGLLHEIVDNH